MQLPLFELREPVRLTRADQLARNAEEFLADHPDFWRAFCAFAHELVRAGRGRYSAKAIVERIRWETTITGGADFKVNNSHVSTFARVFAATYPHHAHLFATRERTSAERPARKAAA